MAELRKRKISFIFPVYNEEAYLEKQIGIFLEGIKELGLKKNYEVLLVENGSRDKTWKVITKLTGKYKEMKACQIKGASYGRAVKQGLLSAQGNHVYVLNVDYFDMTFIKKSLALIDKYGIVVGSKTDRRSIDKRSFFVKLRTRTLVWILRKFFKYPGTDTHGVKVFANNLELKKTVLECFSKNEFFDTELVLRLLEKKWKYKELPIVIKEIRPTRYKAISRVIKTLADVFRILVRFALRGRVVPNWRVEADDYGLDEAVNRSILGGVEAGGVDMVSVMANLCSEVPGKAVSIHLNLLRGNPLSGPDEVKSLVNKEGEFLGLPKFCGKLLLGWIDLKEVALEVERQISKLIELKGEKIEYLASEQHVHLFRPIHHIVSRACLKHGVKYVRSKKTAVYYLKGKPFKLLVFYLLTGLLRLRYLNLRGYKKPAVYEALITHPGSDFD